MDFLSFLRGGGYPTVPIMRPQITGAQMPNLASLAQFVAMLRPHQGMGYRTFGTNALREPMDFIGNVYIDPYTGKASTTR